MVRRAVCSVFIMDDLYVSATCDWLDLPSFTSDLSQKSVSPQSPWFSYDASVLLSRSPLLPDWGCAMRFNPIVLALLLTTAFTGDECFQVGEDWCESLLVAFYCSLFICFYCLVPIACDGKFCFIVAYLKILNSMNKEDNEWLNTFPVKISWALSSWEVWSMWRKGAESVVQGVRSPNLSLSSQTLIFLSFFFLK